MGGNHSTAACREIVALHFRKNTDGDIVFHKNGDSRITDEEDAMKFKYRFGHVVISPLPYELTKKCPRLRTGLLKLATELNDKAKLVKTATLYDQLKKARQAVRSFLRSVKDPQENLIFPPGACVWPQTHGDLEKPVYSSAGISKEVKNVLSNEYQSSFSAIKQLVTTPKEVYHLLLELVVVVKPVKAKTEETKFVIGSVKNILCYTLTFTTKSILMDRLRTLLQDVDHNPRAVVSKHTKKHTEEVSLLRCLNAICTDFASTDKKCIPFLTGIGQMNDDGFYEEANFAKVNCYPTFSYLFSFTESLGLP